MLLSNEGLSIKTMWYLKKNTGDLFGPADLTTFQTWVADGRVDPDDTLSQDKQSWIPAPDLPELAMNWLIEVEDEQQYGPVHLLMLRDPIREGTLSPQTRIRHKQTHEALEAGEACLGELIDSYDQVLEECRSLRQQKNRLQKTASTPPIADPHAELVSKSAELRQQWTEAIQEKDRFKKEARKWEKLYQEETEKGRKKRKELEEQIQHFQRHSVHTHLRIDQLQKTLGDVEKRYENVQATDAARKDAEPSDEPSPGELLEAYHTLSRDYDTLHARYKEQLDELKKLLATQRTMEKETEELLQAKNRLLQQEQEAAHTARLQLAEVEESHLQLVRAYRILNNQVIQLKQEHPKAPPPE